MLWTIGYSRFLCTHFQIDRPGHDQWGNQEISHSQADHQVVGGGLESFLSKHGNTHQNVPKHNSQDEQGIEHGIVIPLHFFNACYQAVVSLRSERMFWVIPLPFTAAKHCHEWGRSGEREEVWTLGIKTQTSRDRSFDNTYIVTFLVCLKPCVYMQTSLDFIFCKETWKTLDCLRCDKYSVTSDDMFSDWQCSFYIFENSIQQ